MPNAWTEDDIEKLIALYGQYQCLWNPSHPEFSNKSSRYKAYKKIKNSINISGLTICDCINRITNVKKEYCYELSKITAAIFCEKFYSPKAKWFERMHMLFFPYMSSSHYNNFKKLTDNELTFYNSGIQDNFLHSSFKKSEDKQIRLNNNEKIELNLKLRENSTHCAQELQNALIPYETTQTIDTAVGTSSGIIADHETQTDMHDEPKYSARVNEEKKDCSTQMDDISVEVHRRKRIEDNFDIFGKSVAFQLRTIDIQSAVELENEIQNLMTKARLKTLECKLMDQYSTSFCCCDCNDCKIMCKDEICSCGLTLKECLLLAKQKDSKNYRFQCK